MRKVGEKYGMFIIFRPLRLLHEKDIILAIRFVRGLMKSIATDLYPLLSDRQDMQDMQDMQDRQGMQASHSLAQEDEIVKENNEDREDADDADGPDSLKN